MSSSQTDGPRTEKHKTKKKEKKREKEREKKKKGHLLSLHFQLEDLCVEFPRFIS